MDMSTSWLLELEMQDQGSMNQYLMNKPYCHDLMEDFSVDSFSSNSYTQTPSFMDQSFQTRVEEPFNFKKGDSINKKFPPSEKPKPKLVSDDSNSFTISFGDIKSKNEFLSDRYVFKAAAKTESSTIVKNPIQVQDHVLAERKRREKLAQRFISLSSLLPDLKKMDKATVLEDAANYIQELQSRLKELERKNMQGSGIACKRPRLSSSDDNSSSSNEANFEKSSSPCDPGIEVRTSGCNLLVEIYSRANCISLVKVLSKMHEFGLSIISCSTMPFADTTLVTIVAQKNNDFIMSSADLVKNLQLVV